MLSFATGGVFNFFNTVGGSLDALIAGGTYVANTTYLVAGRYAENDFKLYLNGSPLGSDTSVSTNFTATLNRFGFDSGNGFSNFFGRNDEASLWKTAFSDAQLEELTTNGL